MCNITIDLGNIWDALSATGTIGATIVALWLGLRKTKKQLDIVLLWDYITRSKPVVYLSNPTPYTVAVKSLQIVSDKERIAFLELTKIAGGNYNGLITANDTKQFVFENIDLNSVSIFDYSTDDNKKKLKIIVTDVYDNNYIKTICVSEKELKIQKAGKSLLNNERNDV